MTIRVRPYRVSDRDHLIACLDELHDAMVRVDPWGQLRRTDDHGVVYSAQVLKRVRKLHGFVLVAEADRRPVGVCIGWVEPASKLSRTQTRPTRAGHVSDLVVLSPWRGKGIGGRLLRAAERIFREDGCDVTGLGVFYPNSGARRLYRRSGYTPRGMYLSKRLADPPPTWAQAIKPRRKRDVKGTPVRRRTPRRSLAGAARSR